MKTRSKLICILLLAITLRPGTSSAQSINLKNDSAHLLLDTVLSFAKHNSLYRNKVDWKKVEDSVRLTAENAVTTKEVLPSIQLLYKLLGDHHGFITYGNKSYRWEKAEAKLDPKTHKALIKKGQEKNKVSSCILEKGYGYLQIPNNNPTHQGDIEKIATQIRDSLLKLNPQQLKGLIIDLRLNYGGNLSAVLGGLTTLFKPGKLGSFVYPVTGQAEEWGIINDRIFAGTDTTHKIPGIGKSTYNLKVVVLIGPYTRSSGEAAAISFKGRKNTLFIGENSGGYTTSNNSFQFTKEIGFFIATAVEADRNGHIYLDNVQPDQEIIGGDDFEDLKKDEKIIAGLKWLKGNN